MKGYTMLHACPGLVLGPQHYPSRHNVCTVISAKGTCDAMSWPRTLLSAYTMVNKIIYGTAANSS